GRTIACRVSQLDRRLKVRDQTLVGVGGRVGDGIQCTGVLDDAANVVQRKFRQTRITVTGEQVLAIFPDGLVNVHTRTVITHDGFRHEGRSLAINVSNVAHGVLEHLVPVSAFHQRAETGADLKLTRAGHFVVMHFNRHALLLEQQAHFRAHVCNAVDRGHGNITALYARTVPQIGAFHFHAPRPHAFLRAASHTATRWAVVPAHTIEYEEPGFRAKVGRITQTAGLQVGFRAL